jgi:hypothetical protein
VVTAPVLFSHDLRVHVQQFECTEEILCVNRVHCYRYVPCYTRQDRHPRSSVQRNVLEEGMVACINCEQNW